MRWLRDGAGVATWQTQELGRHREFASFTQTRPRRFKKTRRTCEVDGTYRDEFVDVPRRKLPSFVIRKRARGAIVSGVSELPGDELGPRGSFSKRKSGELSCPANEFTDIAYLGWLRDGSGYPKTSQPI